MMKNEKWHAIEWHVNDSEKMNHVNDDYDGW